MALSEDKIKGYIKRLLMSRMRILNHHGFFGLLLMHMVYAVDEQLDTACTDGTRIIFGTDFLDKLSDSELDFIMMHEILHVALQHCFRSRDKDKDIFNTACDIVVNSNILLENNSKISSITLQEYGSSIHEAPNGKEGYLYTAEQVYDMLISNKQKTQGYMGNNTGQAEKGNGGGEKTDTQAKSWDDHSRWGSPEDDNLSRDIWMKRIEDAAKAIEIRDPSNERGLLPLFAERLMKKYKNHQTDWRAVLNDFVQEEIADYSFTPPDRRFIDNPFFLPDFNEKDQTVKDILFMIDTSGSISDEMLAAAYSEIKGAIDQFNGKLNGWLGFFDAQVTKPQPFENEDELKIIKPIGGGGTNFQVVFQYVTEKMTNTLPASIIILTDGYAPFPEKKCSAGIPVLWLLNNETVNPPWGKVARIKV